jgi:hypothetical protein
VMQQAVYISLEVFDCRKAFIAIRNIYCMFSNASPCKVQPLFYDSCYLPDKKGAFMFLHVTLCCSLALKSYWVYILYSFPY